MAGLRASLLSRRIGTGVAATALATAAGLPGAAAASSDWQTAFRAHEGTPTVYNGLISVSASGKTDAWAVGGTDTSGGTPGAPLAERWNGTRWQATTLPSGLTGTLSAVSTPAPRDVWAVSQLTGYALHWNGTAWSVAKKWPEPQQPHELTGVTAFSPADVWVFGAPGAYPGLGTWHLTGTMWTKVTGLAGGISTASALSPTSMWAISSDGNAPEDIIMQYDGTTWRRISSPALDGLQFSAILAKTATDVYAVATVGGSPPQRLVHFDGQRWTSVAVPSSVQLGAMAADGMRGEWFTAAQSSSKAPAAEHRSSTGTWSSHALPGGSGQAFGIALIPGTTSLWASGTIQTSGGSDAVIWDHGPAA